MWFFSHISNRYKCEFYFTLWNDSFWNKSVRMVINLSLLLWNTTIRISTFILQSLDHCDSICSWLFNIFDWCGFYSCRYPIQLSRLLCQHRFKLRINFQSCYESWLYSLTMYDEYKYRLFHPSFSLIRCLIGCVFVWVKCFWEKSIRIQLIILL